jgi:hypothetical protein
MSKHLPRYFLKSVCINGEPAPARWEIFDRQLSSETSVVSATSASLAETIVAALNGIHITLPGTQPDRRCSVSGGYEDLTIAENPAAGLVAAGG